MLPAFGRRYEYVKPGRNNLPWLFLCKEIILLDKIRNA